MHVKINLKEIRQERHLTQLDLAIKTGMTPFTIQHIENGRGKSITFNSLIKICSVLDCEPGDLLKLEKD